MSDKDTGEKGVLAAPISPVSWLDENDDLGPRTRFSFSFQAEPIEQVVNEIQNWPIDMSKTWIDEDGDVRYGDEDEFRPITPHPKIMDHIHY